MSQTARDVAADAVALSKEHADRADALAHDLAYMKAEKDKAYAERDRLVAALSKQYPSHLAWHVEPEWEDDWRNIVCIHLPTGQATWHIHDAELPLFGHLTRENGHWDGHSTEEKYERVGRLPVRLPLTYGL